MKKNSKKVSVVLLATVLASSFASCGPQIEESHEIDASKTQLIVSNYNGGFGDEWLKDAIKRFEEKYENYEFEPGKKGAQITIDNHKTTGMTQIATVNSREEFSPDVFFNESVYYYDYVSQGKVLDITDIVTEKLTEYGEEQSILDKMSQEQRNYYTTNGKIYMLPHYQGIKFLTYDVDLFDLYNLYFADDQENSDDGFVWNLEEKRAPGPDGESGTWDDGMPATYDDFFKLCKRMKLFSIVPVAWSGDCVQYIDEFLFELMADYEGVEQFSLNFTFDGTAKNLISVDNGVVTKLPEEKITIDNAGYTLAKQAGKYYAFSFLDSLIDGNYQSETLTISGVTHRQAQKEFLYSSVLNKPIAMFLDGNYWVNEASSDFTTMEARYGANYSKRNRHLGIMPYPKATKEKVGEKNTFVDYLNSAGFIKSNIAENKKELAKKFLQFCYTDESLDLFSYYTETARSLNYKISDTTYNSMGYFGKQYIDFVKNSNWVLPQGNNNLYKENSSTFTPGYFASSIIKGDEIWHAISAFTNYNISGEDYFKGHIALRNEDQWNVLIKK